MILTGIRIGELSALNTQDVNCKEMMIRINKTITRDEVGEYSIGNTPKTDAGNREIQLAA